MKYFVVGEFACKHCGQLPPKGMSPVLLQKLDELRARVGAPIIVTSGWRCSEHNHRVGGVSNSQHIRGTAADIICYAVSVNQLAQMAAEVGFDGIGAYYLDGFVHVDVRDGGGNPNRYRW